jgi:hypothetical protein
MLEEVFLPERPTFQPNTAGWAAEDTSDLAPLGDLPAAERAVAAVATLQSFCSQLESIANTPHDGGSSGSKGKRHCTAADFRGAYAAGTVTPAQVAENIIAAVAASEAQVGCPLWLGPGWEHGLALATKRFHSLAWRGRSVHLAGCRVVFHWSLEGVDMC